MGFIQLNGADVSLQRVHRLILLLIEDADGAPSVGGRLGFVDGMTIGDERIVNLAKGGVATAQKVPERENSNIAINMDKPYPSFPSVSFFFLLVLRLKLSTLNTRDRIFLGNVGYHDT